MSASSLLHPDKRTLIIDFCTSALGQKQTSAASFDHLVGEREQKRWNLEAEYLGRLEIEVEKELRWSHDRQDRRICAIENQACVSSAYLRITDSWQTSRSISSGPLPDFRAGGNPSCARNSSVFLPFFLRLSTDPFASFWNLDLDQWLRGSSRWHKLGVGFDEWSAMRRPISDTAETVIPCVPNARNSVPNSKILLLGTFAALVVLVAVPIFFPVDIPQATASSTLKCYDSAGNHEPCLMRASASPPGFDGRTTDRPHQPPSWITTALYQPASWTTAALYQPANWATTALHQPASGTTTAPAVGRNSTPGRRAGYAICRQRFIPCFLSALRRRLTHIASLARARPDRERL